MPHARKRSREWQRRQCMGCCYGIDTSSCSGGATVAEGSKAHRVGGLLPLFQHDERVLAKEQLEEEFRVGRDRFCARDHHQRQTACTKKADSPVAEKQCALGVGGGSLTPDVANRDDRARTLLIVLRVGVVAAALEEIWARLWRGTFHHLDLLGLRLLLLEVTVE